MKSQLITVLLITLIAHTNALQGYHKICYSKYPYIKNVGYQISSEQILEHATFPKKMKTIDYTVSCNNDQECSVSLTSRDKRRIEEYLKGYDDSTPITDVMIQELLHQGLRKQMIGWVLEDFKYCKSRNNRTITVSDIRSALNLKE